MAGATLNASKSVVLGSAVSVSDVDDGVLAWLDGERGEDPSDRTLDFDLRKATSIHPVALLHLLAVIVSRSRRALSTTLRLPKRPEVREFLRSWNFEEAVATAAGVSLHRLAHSDDTSAFGGDPLDDEIGYEVYDHSEIASPADDGLVRYLEETRFFGLVVYDLVRLRNVSQMIEQECSRWLSPEIVEFLDRYLTGYCEDVSRVHVFELLANTTQHPGADTVALVATASGAPNEPDNHSFNLSVWDNGAGIVDTLRKALQPDSQGYPHRKPTIRVSPPRRNDKFFIKAVGWTPPALERTARWTPTLKSHDGEFLLASLFSGISEKGSWPPHRYSHPHSPIGPTIGEGLCALYGSVIDDFGGTVLIRTGNYLLRVTGGSGSRPGSYNAEISYRGKIPFDGNMVTVQAPLSP